MRHIPPQAKPALSLLLLPGFCALTPVLCAPFMDVPCHPPAHDSVHALWPACTWLSACPMACLHMTVCMPFHQPAHDSVRSLWPAYTWLCACPVTRLHM